MRVNIGPYRGDLISVSSWVRRYTFWRHNTYYLDEEKYDQIDKIVYGFLDWLDDLLRPINRWDNSRRRKVKVHIDNFDVWAADHTLAMIIAPTLKKLKENKHGCPHVDNEDVPKELRCVLTEEEKKNWDGTVDDRHEARWEWILNEMIWAFEQHADPDDNDAQFHHNSDQLDMVFTPVEGMMGQKLSFNYQKDPSKPAYWVDRESKLAHYERMKNGVRLFAKYYESLWD